MKQIIILLAFIVFSPVLKSQIEVDIKLLQISNVGIFSKDSFSIPESFVGPIFTFEAQISNHSDSVVYLDMNNVRIELMYTYKDSIYSILIDNIYSKYNSEGNISIEIDDSIMFYFGCNIFENSYIYKGAYRPYYKEIIEMIPTMKLCFYEDKIQRRIYNIQKVILIDDIVNSILPRE